MKEANNITHLHHIGFATHNPLKYLKQLKENGGVLEHTGTCHYYNTNCWFVRFNGILLELIKPLNDKSPIHKYLKKKGEGLHHLAFNVKTQPNVCFDGALPNMKIKFNELSKDNKLLIEEVYFNEVK